MRCAYVEGRMFRENPWEASYFRILFIGTCIYCATSVCVVAVVIFLCRGELVVCECTRNNQCLGSLYCALFGACDDKAVPVTR